MSRNFHFEQAMLDLIPPDANQVLELGFKETKLCDRYKSRNPDVYYRKNAIVSGEGKQDTDSNAEYLIELLKQLLSKGKLVDLDCLVLFGHIFSERMVWQDLRQLLDSIKEECLVLISVFNREQLQNISAFTNLINPEIPGNLTSIDQKTSGPAIFDQIRNTLNDTGFNYVDIIKLTGKNTSKKNGPRHQIVIRARKNLPPKQLLIHYRTLNPVAACNDKRIHEPDKFLQTIPGIRTFTNAESIINSDVLNYSDNRILVWQRPIMKWSNSIDKLQKLIQLGFLIIVDFDDDPRRWQEIIENDYLTFKGVHAVQTSTGVLADFLRRYNPNVIVFENQMMELPQDINKSNNGRTRLFFGALNREEDWQHLMPVINRILEKYRDKLGFTVVHDRQFFDALATSNKLFQPMCNYNVYLQLLQASDIALLPLQQTDFNQNKSDLKFIENAACRTVSFASPVVYAETIIDGETGLLYENEKEFEDKIEYLINNPEARLQISDNAFRWVQQHRLLGQHFKKRYQWYMELLDRLPQLNDELQSRVPVLFQ